MNTTYAHQPLIANFPVDILEYIFLLSLHKNVEDIYPVEHEISQLFGNETVRDFDEWRSSPSTPVSTSRSSSQVSRWWRSVAVKSQRLWGRLLDTQHFPIPDTSRPESMEWWNVVVHRSGTAALWVDCVNEGEAIEDGSEDQLRAAYYLLPLLEANIHRVERLGVRLRLRNGLEMDPRWGVLRQIGSTAREVSLLLNPFPVIRLGVPALNIGALLTTTMCSMQSFAINMEFSAPHLLDCLKYLPQLRDLTVLMPLNHAPAHFPVYRPQEVVSLKHLEALELHNMFADTVQLLPRIQTKEGCKLSIIGLVLPDQLPPNDADAKAFKNSLSLYFKGALCTPAQHQRPSTGFAIDGNFNRLHLTMNAAHYGPGCDCVGDPYRVSNQKSTTLHFDVYCDEDDDQVPSWILEDVMHVVCTCRAPMLTSLDLLFNFLDVDLSASFWAVLPEFFDSLTSMTDLTIGNHWLHLIVALAEASMSTRTGNAWALFPALKTLDANFHNDYERAEASISIIRRFFGWRNATSRPLSRLLLDDWMARMFRAGIYPGIPTVTGVKRESDDD